MKRERGPCSDCGAGGARAVLVIQEGRLVETHRCLHCRGERNRRWREGEPSDAAVNRAAYKRGLEKLGLDKLVGDVRRNGNDAWIVQGALLECSGHSVWRRLKLPERAAQFTLALAFDGTMSPLGAKHPGTFAAATPGDALYEAVAALGRAE